MALISSEGDPVLSEEERKVRLDELIGLTSQAGLKKLVQVKTLQDAQKLWLSGDITSEQLAVFVLAGIALDVNGIKRLLKSFIGSMVPRPGGGIQ